MRRGRGVTFVLTETFGLGNPFHGAAAMRPYNLLLIDGNDQVRQIETIAPVDPTTALQTAEAVLMAHSAMSGFELWQGSRHIATRRKPTSH